MVKRLIWLPALLWAVFIFLLSSRTQEGPPPAWWFTHADKLIHAALFGILAMLILLPLRALHRWPRPRATLAAFFVSLAYGCSDEWHQRYTPTRSPDLFDVAADGAGASLVFATLLRRKTDE